MNCEIIEILFGNYSIIEIFGFLWFFMIGYIIYGLNEVSSRNKYSVNTPRKWSWKFWLLDNKERYITTILYTYILFRFYSEMSGHEFGYFDAVTLGLIGDGISASIKNRFKNINNKRNKIMRNINDDDI